MKVLLVDDSKILQERIIGLINECGNVKSIYQSFNTLEAKNALENEKFDVIISDIRMPGGDGFTLIEHIKEKQKHAKTIMITNYPEEVFKRKANELGVDYFLSKADDMDQLPEILKSFSFTKHHS